MDVDRIRERIAGTTFADVHWSAETESTNADLMAAAVDGAAGGRVQVTDHQTAGRGRRGREWTEPAGSSLLVSVLFRPAEVLRPDEGHVLTIATALAAAEAVGEVAAVPLDLKWPNDVVWHPADPGSAGPSGYRKVAGVLAESVVAGGELDVVVVGTGMNVNWPGEPPAGATAVNRLAGADIDRADLLAAWLLRLDRWWSALGRGRSDDLLRAYRSRLSTLGRDVTVDTGSELIEGTAVDVTHEGHLEVDVGGRRRTFAVGDVVHLVPR